VGRSDAYRQSRFGENKPHPAAFRSATTELIENSEDALSESDRAILEVLKHVGVFIDAGSELDRLSATEHTKRLSTNQLYYRKGLKEKYVIPFNHSLKELINVCPNVPIKAMATTLAQGYSGIFGKYNSLNSDTPRHESELPRAGDVAQTFETIINGMRHEIAAETMLASIGVDYSYDVSVRDDATGTDLFVYINGVAEPIDIKGSKLAETKAHERHSASRAVWTGLEYADFTGIKGTNPGSVSIPNAIAQEKAPDFYDRILEVTRNKVGSRPALRDNQLTLAQQAAKRMVR
jgi:hypothetical protein